MQISEKLTLTKGRQLLMARNCILEGKESAFRTCAFLVDLAKRLDVDYVFKASYKKDNRSSAGYFAGLPLPEALEIFSQLKAEFGVPLITDVHYPEELGQGVAEVFDILQIPAYLAMQTGLVLAVAETGKAVNLKKAQFLHPEDMAKVVKKVESVGNHKILLTERGTCFGYRDMVVDPRAFHIMKQTGYPVLFDAGHSIRKYGVPSSDPAGGAKEFLPTLMSTSAAASLSGLFVEVHPDPPRALCDAASQLSFEEAEVLIGRYMKIAKFVAGLD